MWFKPIKLDLPPTYESKQLRTWLCIILFISNSRQLTMITLIINSYYNLRYYNWIHCFLLTIKSHISQESSPMEYSCWKTRQKRIPGKRAKKRCETCACYGEGFYVINDRVDYWNDVCAGWPWKYSRIARAMERTHNCKFTCDSFESFGATPDSYR